DLSAVSDGREVVVMVKVGVLEVTEIDNDPDADCTGELESVTFTVKLLVCAELLSVPLIVPFEAKVNADGKLPELTTQLYGAVPPEAFSALEYELPAVPSDREAVELVP